MQEVTLLGLLFNKDAKFVCLVRCGAAWDGISGALPFGEIPDACMPVLASKHVNISPTVSWHPLVDIYLGNRTIKTFVCADQKAFNDACRTYPQALRKINVRDAPTLIQGTAPFLDFLIPMGACFAAQDFKLQTVPVIRVAEEEPCPTKHREDRAFALV